MCIAVLVENVCIYSSVYDQVFETYEIAEIVRQI